MALEAQATAPAAVDRRVLDALEHLLAEIYKAIRAVNFYPPGHPMLVRIHQGSFEQVAKAARYFGEIEIDFSRQHLSYRGNPIGAENEVIQSLTEQLFKRRMKKLILLDGIGLEEYQIFLEAAALDSEEVYLRGGIDTILAEAQVRHVWANQIDFDRLRHADEPQPAHPPEPPPFDSNLFLDSMSLDESTQPEEELSSDGQRDLAQLLPRLDQTLDPDHYYETIRILAQMAEQFVAEHQWHPLFKIVSRLEVHSSDPNRGVEFKKYSYRALRKIGTPEVLRALLTELTSEGRMDDEIESLISILAILGAPAADAILSRLGFVKDDYARKLLEHALMRIGPIVANRIYPLLGSDDPSAVSLALRVLGHYRLPESVGRIGRLSSHKSEVVQQERVRTLLRIRTAAALDQIYDVLMERNEPLRKRIVQAFGHSREVRAAKILMDLVRSQKEFSVSSEIRALIFQALGRIGGEQVADALLGFVSERKLWRPRYDEESLDEALGALAEMGQSEHLARLRDIHYKNETLQQAHGAACQRLTERLATERKV